MTIRMQIYGVDFTSAPSRKKPITCAAATFDGTTLTVRNLDRWSTFNEFEAALQAPGPWTMAIDFPFGQSRKLVQNIGWPRSWAGYVGHVGAMTREEFRQALNDYKAPRPAGDKQHKRVCDKLTRSQSPQMLSYTPVGLMFFEGAPRLLKAGVHLPYNHYGDETRVVLEAYPGVAARTLIGRTSYKNDNPRKQTDELALARRTMLSGLLAGRCEEIYGFALSASMNLADDPSGDELDAVLCAIQAAWGWQERQRGYGAPADQDRLEGWIADPSLLGGELGSGERTPFSLRNQREIPLSCGE